jgi:hypothetical protein
MNNRSSLGFASIIALVSLAGCSATVNSVPTHSSVNAVQEQDTSRMIDDLGATLWNADYSGMSREAWDWTLAHMETVWNLEMSKEARARLRKCWFDVKNNPTVENKANFDKCWADLRQSSK